MLCFSAFLPYPRHIWLVKPKATRQHFVSCLLRCRRVRRCGQEGAREVGKRWVVTNIVGKWQAVSRLTRREMAKRENERVREEAGSVWHYSITIRAVLDFPTFQNRETNFSQSPFPPSGSRRMNGIIFPESPAASSLYLALYRTPSTVEFYYLSYAFLNSKRV